MAFATYDAEHLPHTKFYTTQKLERNSPSFRFRFFYREGTGRTVYLVGH